MHPNPPVRRRSKPSEEGYILVAVMFMLVIFVIALSVAAPKIAKQIQRDREVETMHRGKQYARAVKLYYKKFGAYPPNIDALVKTNEIRFLRKRYLDPITGKDDWKPIPVGQNKTQTLGFFGQPIGGSAVGGIGPSGGNGLNGGSTLGGSTIGGLGSTGTTDGGSDNSGSTDSSGGTDSNGQNGSSTNGANGSNGTNGSGGANSGTGSTFGSNNGQTFGGVGIMGFSPGSPKQSILVYKKKNHYKDWEFFYDPIAEQMLMQGGNSGAIGTPASGMSGSSPIGGGTNSSGSTIGGGSTGGGSNPGSSPQPQ